MSEIIVTKRHIPIIQFLAHDGTRNLQEIRLDVEMTMEDLIRLAGDEAEIIGILEPCNFVEPYRDISEEAARAYLDTVEGSGMMLRKMPHFVQRSKAARGYSDEVSYVRPHHNRTYQAPAGRVA